MPALLSTLTAAHTPDGQRQVRLLPRSVAPGRVTHSLLLVLQLAATVLAYRLGALWSSLTPEERAWSVDATLGALRLASSATLRVTAELVNVVAQCVAADDPLRDRLLGAVAAAASAQEVRVVCTALHVVTLLLDSLGARMAPFHAGIAQLLPHALESHAETRAAAAVAAGALAGTWCLADEARPVLQQAVIPALLACASRIGYHSASPWHGADGAVLEALAECASLVAGKDVTLLAGLALQRASAADVHPAVRLSCLHLLTALAEAQPKAVSPDAPAAASALVPLCDVAASPRHAHHHEDGDGDDDEAQHLAGAARDCLAALSASLPNRAGLAHPVFRAIQDAFDGRSHGPSTHAGGPAALRALAATCEGLKGEYRARAQPLVHTIARAMALNQHPRLRAAAADAAVALVAALPLECAALCGSLLSAAGAAAGGDPSPGQRVRASLLLAALARELATDELEPHLDGCVTALLQGLVVDNPASVGAAASALGALAAASGDAFAPYAGASLGALAPWVSAVHDPSQGQEQCCAAAISAAGAVLAAAPQEVRIAGWPSLHAAAAAGFARGQGPLREAALQCWAAVAKAEDEAFSPSLGPCVQAALTCATDALACAAGEVHTGAVEEGVAAAEALGAFACATGYAFLPYLSDALRCLDALASHPQASVRAAACRAIPPALSPLTRSSSQPLAVEAAAPSQDSHAEMAAAGTNLACGVLSRLAAMMMSDPNSDVVAEACAAASDVAFSALVMHDNAASAVQVETTVRATLEALEAVVSGAAACQAEAASAAKQEDEGADGDCDDDLDDDAASLAQAAGEAKAAILDAVARRQRGMGGAVGHR